MPIYSYLETETTKFNFVSDTVEVPVPILEYAGRHFIFFDGDITGQPSDLDFQTHELTDPVVAEIRNGVTPSGTPLQKENALAELGLSDLDRVHAQAIREVTVYTRAARATIAGTDDAVKLAEYTDKAALAERVLGGAATEAETATVMDEAADFDLTTAEDMAVVWRTKANALRAARNVINRLGRNGTAAIEGRRTIGGVLEALAAVKDELEKAVLRHDTAE